MRHLASRLVLAALFAASFPAGAAFHLFSISEIYSNASGSVQFVELTALSGGQQFTSGHSLTVTGVLGNTVICNSSPNLPGDTSGKKMLFGTAGLQAAFNVTPDYVCPAGFLDIGGGLVNWGEGSDRVTYTALPTNGSSVNRNGTPGTATPQNFNGVIGVAQPLPAPAYQGMWWAAAGNESGWGINTAHQGDTLFATWFTFAADSSGLWMILSNGAKIAEGQYRGDIFTVRGPAFNAVPFAPPPVATSVGNGTFTFTSPTTGSFQYTVNGIAQTKQIARFEFVAGAVPNCTAGGTPVGLNYQDIWWNSPGGSESGWGLNVVHQGNILFLTWFTYDATGKGQWLVMPNVPRTTGETFSGAIFRVTGNPFNSTPWSEASIHSTNVGTATVTFSDRSNGTFTYTLDGITQSKPITRTVFNPTGTQTVCNAP